ncbi:hypothetical protein CLAFUW4_10845 [Fulvia fulva]|uniref:F-box domain-containing protein n=1 Tax=Passalora fulva TaxID=5499 RepID=A0A9Q8PCJ9_PASFU|nr:uncharacterized protein CLAFUR5_09888 [Fulvia fulva]KAK4619790.1 hypothetical protein CLAFUR4_10850 [Fulvia fulva]KAK4620319.1 hypothetical protein CLAFUR0_10857 [Fulvia fulva]UJO19922.1 hypothetical protein CLAFUR5_09888 [Fulvia fulva]WPV17402.1 hypothetical protein CLAFUW4_10845 [Fulvia fulva]WPV32305.1 hypothetical protein CLAFUW7_10843 [Fulvia fulva]
MAAARVFAIPELLENILLSCEPYRLFMIRRVNTAFSALIGRSLHIRRLMCLEHGYGNPYQLSGRIHRCLHHHATVYPFRIDWITRIGSALDLEFELRRDFIEAHKEDQVVALLNDPTYLAGLGSWTSVRVGFPGQKFRFFISCQGLLIASTATMLPGDPTFGHVVEQGFKIVQRKWNDIAFCHKHDKYRGKWLS